MIYFVTVNYNSSDLIAKLIQSIKANCGGDYKFIIVNNSANDSAIHALENEQIIAIESGNNLGFGSACNLGLNWIYARDRGAIIWLINPDTYLMDNSLAQAEQFFQTNSEVSIAGTLVYEPTGKIWFSGGEFIPKTGKIITENAPLPSSQKPYIETQWVTGCSLLINLKKFDSCPQFDPDYFLYYEDCDFCLRYAGEGHRVAIAPAISVIHHPSSITSRNLDLRIQFTTYSYLLTLEKHTSHLVLLYRLARIVLSSLIALPFERQLSKNELKGVLKYCQRLL